MQRKHLCHPLRKLRIKVNGNRLKDMKFSCFACKLKDEKSKGKCAYRDDLSPLLEKAMDSDILKIQNKFLSNQFKMNNR